MVIIINFKVSMEEIQIIREVLEAKGLETYLSKGDTYYILCLIGDTSVIDIEKLKAYKYVDEIIKVQEPFKKTSKMFKFKDTAVNIEGSVIGGGKIGIIAGPCSVENEEQIIKVAKRVKAAGANFLRGGVFKPRTSPYSFQGLGIEGLELLKIAKQETGLPIVTELMSTDYLDAFVEEIDMIQIGARNMQNFDLLKQIGKTRIPVLLKRGLSATIEEWLMSAEYIMAGGNENIVLCERGIRTFETHTRNTLDLQSIPVIKKISHLPIIVDPSHAGGYAYLVEPMAKAAVIAGADGLMIEVHNDPENALSDGQQALTPSQFDSLMDKIKVILNVEGKVI